MLSKSYLIAQKSNNIFLFGIRFIIGFASNAFQIPDADSRFITFPHIWRFFGADGLCQWTIAAQQFEKKENSEHRNEICSKNRVSNVRRTLAEQEFRTKTILRFAHHLTVRLCEQMISTRTNNVKLAQNWYRIACWKSQSIVVVPLRIRFRLEIPVVGDGWRVMRKVMNFSYVSIRCASVSHTVRESPIRLCFQPTKRRYVFIEFHQNSCAIFFLFFALTCVAVAWCLTPEYRQCEWMKSDSRRRMRRARQKCKLLAWSERRNAEFTDLYLHKMSVGIHSFDLV